MNMTAKDLGIILGCAEHGVAVESYHVVQGLAKRASSLDNGSVGRLLTKSAHSVMQLCGYGNTAPAMHLLLVSEHPVWNSHCQDVTDHVATVLEVLEPMQKSAFSDVMSGAGTAVRGIGYGSLGAGAGLGALYWLLSRHATQDDADIEAKQRQTEYYNSLSRELNESLSRKYRYNPAAVKPKKKPILNG